jgi:shikimate kinase
MNIILIGFKNCGKTTVGKYLAARLQSTFIDTDRVLENYYSQKSTIKLSVREIYTKEGGALFRALEKNALATLTEIHNTIIATGGGIVIDSDNVTALKKLGTVVYLRATKELLLSRAQSSEVPAFLDQNNKRESFEQMYNERKDIYEAVADYIVEVDKCNVDNIADQILIKCRVD